MTERRRRNGLGAHHDSTLLHPPRRSCTKTVHIIKNTTPIPAASVYHVCSLLWQQPEHDRDRHRKLRARGKNGGSQGVPGAERRPQALEVAPAPETIPFRAAVSGTVTDCQAATYQTGLKDARGGHKPICDSVERTKNCHVTNLHTMEGRQPPTQKGRTGSTGSRGWESVRADAYDKQWLSNQATGTCNGKPLSSVLALDTHIQRDSLPLGTHKDHNGMSVVVRSKRKYAQPVDT